MTRRAARVQRLIGLALLGWATTAVAGDAAAAAPAAGAPPPGYSLVWSDEFDGPLDASRWAAEEGGHGWGNNELQFYTRGRGENARVEGGRLVIEARREPWAGREYTSARLDSAAGWQYGRVEVRARVASGRGTWPAIWMLPLDFARYGWPDGGEIDIMEHVGHDPDVVHASVHSKAFNHVAGTQKTATITVPGARSDFHVYAMEWTASSVRAFVDDREYFRFDKPPAATVAEWPFDKPFRLLLNLAVGGHWGGAQGVDPAIWPQRMEVDFVRVYQRPATP